MNLSKLESYLSEFRSFGVPAFELYVTKDGKTVYQKSEGLESPEKNIYWACSITKISTCVAGMRLIEEGKLRLEDPVYQYLPAYRNLTVLQKDGTVAPAKKVMTVRDLFTMTSGLDYDIGKEPIKKAGAVPGADTISIVNSFVESPLVSEPGTRFKYSLSHDVLAAVVEVVTGIRFSDYLKQLIFDPLGMRDTGFHPTEEVLARMMKQYRHVNELGADWTELTPPGNRYRLSENYDSGGAGLYTTAADQIKLMSVLANGGTTETGYRLLKPETIAMMQVDRLTREEKHGFFTDRLYGYSWGLCGRVHVDPKFSRSKTPVGEFGWDGATGSYAIIDPTTHIAVFLGMHIFDLHYAYRIIHFTLRDILFE